MYQLAVELGSEEKEMKALTTGDYFIIIIIIIIIIVTIILYYNFVDNINLFDTEFYL